MVVKMTLLSQQVVDIHPDDVYKYCITIQTGLDSVLDESNTELRKKLIDEYGNGDCVYLIVIDDITATSLLSNELIKRKTKPKFIIKNPADVSKVKVLHVRDSKGDWDVDDMD